MKYSLYIAVIINNNIPLETDDKILLSGSDGRWSCYIGHDQDAVIQKALNHKENSNLRSGINTYRVLVGEITDEATLNLKYYLKEL